MNIFKTLKINILLFVTSILIASCDNEFDEVKDKPEVKYSTERYSNGKVKGKGAIINGKKNGLWIFYFEGGGVSSEYLFYNDSLSGQYIGYFEDGGDTLITGSYINGQEDGEWRSFFGNSLLARKAYYKMGEKQVIGNIILKMVGSIKKYIMEMEMKG